MSSEMEALPQQARTEPEERGLAQESGSHAGKPRSSLHCITFLLTSGHKLNGQCCKNETIKKNREEFLSLLGLKLDSLTGKTHAILQ